MARKNSTTDVIDLIEVMEIDGSPLRGMRICISGHLSKSRNEIVKLVENGGGTIHQTVTSNTTHLLTNMDWNSGSVQGVSSKLKKAKQTGIKIINEKQFIALLGLDLNA